MFKIQLLLFFNKVHGSMKGWVLSFGKGTYRESNFKELYDPPTT